MTSTRFAPVVVREIDRRLAEALRQSEDRSTSLRSQADEALDQLDVSDVLDGEASDPAAVHHGEAIALAVSSELVIAEIVAARDRLHAGVYGTCERCAAPVPLARLRALPETRWCVDCSQTIGAQGRTLAPLPR